MFENVRWTEEEIKKELKKSKAKNVSELLDEASGMVWVIRTKFPHLKDLRPDLWGEKKWFCMCNKGTIDVEDKEGRNIYRQYETEVDKEGVCDYCGYYAYYGPEK